MASREGNECREVGEGEADHESGEEVLGGDRAVEWDREYEEVLGEVGEVGVEWDEGDDGCGVWD